MKINLTYLSRCADKEFCKANEKSIGKTLDLDKKYVCESLMVCKDVVVGILIPDLQERYKDLTQKK